MLLPINPVLKELSSDPSKLNSECDDLDPPFIFILRKEVIQPQVPLRLPCYDFTPIINHTLGACLPAKAELAQQLLVQSTLVV